MSDHRNKKGTTMKVAEYRALIDACFAALNSVKSAATPHESRVEVSRLESAVRALGFAKCRCHINDQTRAATCLIACRKMIGDKRAQFEAADAAFQSMAFGKFYGA